MTLLADMLSSVFDRRSFFVPAAKANNGAIQDMTRGLIAATDEVSGQTLARQILDRFAAMEDEQKLSFFRHLASDMNVNPAALRTELDAYEADPSGQTYGRFMAAAEPPRQELIRRLNQVSGATKRLVAMRADLLRLGRKEPELQALDLDFRHLFASWFNRGFLVLRPISWESPAHILEKVIAYEAVHEIQSWEDLRRRLAPRDRKCFAFFHPAMPDEPLIFVEVALTKGVPDSIQTLLDENIPATAPSDADTAVFYSISNCQSGLAGISFGNSLIKQVASDLAIEVPTLKTFVTLSPIPGLGQWAEGQGIDLSPDEPDRMRALAAHYLVHAKRGGGLPADPVARFHLGNGAIIHAVHAGADTSEKGLRQSGGAMVNYLYQLEKVADNHARFATGQEVIASGAVRGLAAAWDKIATKDKNDG